MLMFADILPQLFARLNHPVAAVRDTLCALLERVAALAPHAVCFPAIVGATQLIVMHSADSDDEDSECEGKDDEIEGDLLDDEKKRRVEQVCPSLLFSLSALWDVKLFYTNGQFRVLYYYSVFCLQTLQNRLKAL